MRLTLLAVTLLSLAACQPAAAPGAAKVAEKTPTPEELGQDDPSVPFKPAAVGPAEKFEAMSKTAMSITGDLVLTPTPQPSENMAHGAVFAFSMGLTYKGQLEAGMATQGTPAYPHWADIMPGVDPATIEMYTVEEETVPKAAPNGGLCPKTFAIAIGRKKDATLGEVLELAAFSGDEWPPKDPDKVLCGTYNYTPAK